MQRIDEVDVSFLVNNRNGEFPDENKFGMRDVEFLAVGGANRKRAKSAATHPFF
ncbi:MAG TPA: hypothetical protein VMR33_10075 [Candidatus Baltobacteraceae bacterium]|jgi:hypothetical protein|nr:hypothetical protein [Candidatus Baltobacteraceae bacterium]